MLEEQADELALARRDLLADDHPEPVGELAQPEGALE
jgi:hypothetical protein